MLSELVQSVAMKLISYGKSFEQLISEIDGMSLDQFEQHIEKGIIDNYIV